jgi:S-adenosylmethionine:tRNA ribosyltransferase-isomerase
MKYNDISLYDFVLPSTLIAQKNVSPRDSAKLLVYDRETKKHHDTNFLKLVDELSENSLVVFNNTKVIPARLIGHRTTGGKVELLFLEKVSAHEYRVFLSRFIKEGEVLNIPGGLTLEVVSQEEKYFIVRTPLSYLAFLEYLEKHGSMPIPPYIDNPEKNTVLRREYQTVFAKYYGSIAAPTASLHFTNRLLRRLRDKKIETCFITLHVGLGTFAPLEEQHFVTQSLHKELYEVKKSVWKKIQSAKKNGHKVVAVGTTVVRTLESVAHTNVLSGETNIFITPGYTFRVVDALVTNFHLPRSSLILLVSAFIGDREETLSMYNHAVRNKYRFFSFGDGMLIR